MSKGDKILERVLRGSLDASLHFSDLCSLLRRLGFAERIRGGHHIFTRAGIAEIINIQSRQGMAKPYQVKQVRHLILTYALAGPGATSKGEAQPSPAPPATPTGEDSKTTDGT